tara:strand:+ start:6859 stop:7320 length:462 start_codon:yes stop_codon:yes gene_type:complete
MIPAQDVKLVQLLAPVSQSAASAVSAELDTNGYNYATIIFMGGVMATGYSVMQITECDTSGGTFAAFSNDNGVFGLGETSQLNVDGTASADPDGTNAVTYGFEIDVANRKRFLQVSYTAGGTCLSCMFAILSRASVADSDVLATRGFTGLIRA